MRRATSALLFLLCATIASPMAMKAQDFSFHPDHSSRAWLVLSDGVGINGGGVVNSTGIVQLFRAAATVRVTESRGFELAAIRSQEISPAFRVINDRALNDPEADGVTLSFASMARDGPNDGLPATAVIGAGVFRRPTNDVTKTRLTGGLVGGFESSLLKLPVDWADLTAGLRMMLMPVGNHHQIYIVAITGGLRIG